MEVGTRVMTSTLHIADSPGALSRAAIEAEDGGPLMTAHWTDALMLHYRVDARALAAAMPFELDLHEGRAYVSVVAFSMRELRLGVGGRWVAALSHAAMPACSHAFLNVRTYVRHRGEAGIYFLAEWVPSRIARFFGPRTFGLPYRLGELAYEHGPDPRHGRGCVRDAATGARLAYHAQRAIALPYEAAQPGTLDFFLMERYAAFTHHHGVQRRFRVWHEPWRIARTQVHVTDDALLTQAWASMAEAELERAVWCADLEGVWMSRPRWIGTEVE